MSSSLRKLWLIRHPPVAAEFKSLCYGSQDVPLATGWEATIDDADALIASWNIEAVWTSDLARAKLPGMYIATRFSVPLRTDELLRERAYGTWQGVAWSSIPSVELEQAHEMLHDPSGYRPGGGETTDEVVRRGTIWYKAFLGSEIERTVVVSHSGWITAFVGELLGLKPIDWTDHYLKNFEGFSVELSDDSPAKVTKFNLNR